MTTLENVLGKTLDQITADGIDIGSNYPIMESRDGQLVCVGTVDGNYPLEYNDGKWEIVDDLYAVATPPTIAQQVLAVIRDGSRIDRFIERSADGGLFVTVRNHGSQQVAIPVSEMGTEDEDEALAEWLIDLAAGK